MIGTTTWVIGDGYIPPASTGPHPAMTSHDSACMLNANAEPARVEITVYFADRPVVVQHTRLDSRQAANALMTTIAFPVPGGDDRQ